MAHSFGGDRQLISSVAEASTFRVRQEVSYWCAHVCVLCPQFGACGSTGRLYNRDSDRRRNEGLFCSSLLLPLNPVSLVSVG